MITGTCLCGTAPAEAIEVNDNKKMSLIGENDMNGFPQETIVFNRGDINITVGSEPETNGHNNTASTSFIAATGQQPLPEQGNLLRGIDNGSGAAPSVAQVGQKALDNSFS